MSSLLRSTAIRLMSGAAIALAVAAGPARAQEAPAGDGVVATINGSEVTEADLRLMEAELGQQLGQLPPDQRRAAALTAYIEIKLLADAAEEAGLADDPDFARRMELLRIRALHGAYIEDTISSQLTDEIMRARYDEEIAGIEPTNEIRARHIIVESEEEAAAIIAQLDEGGDFEELAREHSQDGAAAQGGDLGYFARGQMVPEFEEAAFALEVGAYSSEPVETQFGWHVIQLVDRRTQTPPSFDQVRAQLRSLMLRELYFDTVSNLREAAAIEISDPALSEAVDALEAGEAADDELPAGEEPAAE